MGMIHEHQNPKGNPIHWDKPKVISYMRRTQGWNEKTTETNVFNKYASELINGSKFDPLSIMLYFFPPSLTTNHQGTQQNLRLSGNDVVYLQKMYPGARETPNEFYENVYNKSIKQALKDSDQASKKMGSVYDWVRILTYILIGFTIVVFLTIIIRLIIGGVRSKHKGRRYS